MSSARIGVNGIDMYYEVHGDGWPLVLLHGAMGTIESCFGELLPRLAATRKVIAPELQGHGHTADADRPLSLEGLARDVAALLDALGIEAADVVGYSMGGGVGLQLAMRRRDLVRRLVFAGGTCYRRAGFHPELLEGIADAGADDLDGSVWHQAYRRVAPHPEAWPRLVAKTREMDLAFSGWAPGEIRAIETPALLLIGDSDIVRPEHAVEMFRLLGGGVIGDVAGMPASQLAILPGTSHAGLLDRVDWLESMVRAFLDRPEQSPR